MIKNKFFKIIKICLPYLFFFFIALTIIFLIILAVKDYNSIKNCNNENLGATSWGDVIKNITSIFTCLTASISLFITTIIRKENLKNRVVDRKNNVMQKWYNSLIIERHLNDIFSFFDNCSNLVIILKEINEKRGDLSYSDYDEQCKQSVMKPFTEQYTNLQYGLISDANVIDTELSNQLNCIFVNFQDEFLEQTQVKDPNYAIMKNYIIDTQSELVKLLRDYNVNIMN